MGDMWEVSSLPGVGRVLVASRDILPWEKVVCDTALVLAPTKHPVCLGCLGPLGPTSIPCSQCSWPVCRQECAVAVNHRAEFGVLTAARVRPEEGGDSAWFYFPVLAVLRLVLLKQEDPDRWRQVEGLMDHWDQHCGQDNVREGIHNITVFIQDRLGLVWVQEQDIQHCYGVLKTNSIAVKAGGQAVFPVASLLSHSCVSNLEPLGDTGDRIVFRAKRRIQRGEELSIRYITFLQCKEDIQERLGKEWMFACSCHRCQDPTEMKTYYSSLQCQCGGFYTQIQNSQESKEETKSRLHKCSDCGNLTDLSSTLDQVSSLSSQLDTNGWSEGVETAVQNLSGCHPSFHLSIQLHIKYLDTFQDDPNTVTALALVERAGYVLDILSALDNGCTKLSGHYLMVLLTARLRLIMMKKEELEKCDLMAVLKDIARNKLKAAKRLSDFCIEDTGISAGTTA